MIIHNLFGKFGLKRCQKKREVMNYKTLEGFSWKLQYLSTNQGFENTVSTDYSAIEWTGFLYGGRKCTLHNWMHFLNITESGNATKKPNFPILCTMNEWKSRIDIHECTATFSVTFCVVFPETDTIIWKT